VTASSPLVSVTGKMLLICLVCNADHMVCLFAL